MKVVSTRELVERVLGFLAGGSRGARGDVGRAAAVCRLWRDVAYGEEVWGRMAAEVLPVLGGGRDGRRYVAEQGRCLVERRVWNARDLWVGGMLRVHFEVWDARDNLRIMSIEGRARWDCGHEDVSLLIKGADRREVVGPPFSAASRGPEHHRFANLVNYFDEECSDLYPAQLNMRVVVRDVRTGRQALLFELGEHGGNEVTASFVGPQYREGLPEGSVYCCTNGPPRLVSHAWGDWEDTKREVDVAFYLQPEGPQEGVDARDKLYRAAGGVAEDYAHTDAPFNMIFYGVRLEKLERYLMRLLYD
jgi:hypothetical protein